ncbi:thermonuclease family protein [Microvirga sp. 2MCAF35]|uniref:thermonuclease family protein n=1 Tax=Microvirga sp. 2MCAF35 TaxID=3232987 RepID=UPI003F96ABA4
MIDDSTTPDSKADPRNNWARIRDRMREVIHAELDRIHPTDDSRRALELIIESSVRPSEENGALKLTIIDHEGKMRMIEKDGQTAEFTLRDLLDELRVKYPVLFRPAKPDAAALVGENEMPQPREAPKRDWLNVDAPPSRPVEDAVAIHHEAREEPTLPERARSTFETLKASVIPDHGDRDRAEDPAIPVAEEHERNVFSETPARSWARPAVALAAVSFLALLGVGAFLFRGHEAPAPHASAAAPIAPGPIKEPEPVTTGSTGSVGSLRGVPDVIDTATLSLNGEVVRLFGVEWAPGAGKPEDLTQYLNGREVTCDPAGGNDVYRCQVGSQDLSRVVLFNGGGRPTDDATPELKAAADKAREAKIGVWSKQQP